MKYTEMNIMENYAVVLSGFKEENSDRNKFSPILCMIQPSVGLAVKLTIRDSGRPI